MANITPYITAIRTARYGEQVRGSIADALEAVNDQVEDDTASAGASASSAATSANTATQAKNDAQAIADDLVDDLADLHQTQAELAVAEAQREQAEQARVVAEQARADQATGYVAQARNYANQAQQYASSDNALLSQSWAVGGTSSRYGEDTNNSKYWAEVAAQVVTEGGVASFNGRTGNVSPMSGDYNAEQITYGSSTVKSAMDGFTSAVDDIINANLLVADDDATPTGEVDFTSADTTLTPTTSESVELLTGSDGWSTRLYKISQMFKNIRYLLKMLGTTDISSIGSGTLTGAISALNSKVSVESASYDYAGITIFFRKVGRICIVTSNSACNVAIPTNAYAANSVFFHEKYKPISQVISRQVQSSNGNNVSVNIDSDGSIRIGYADTQMPSGTLIRIDMCYITAS